MQINRTPINHLGCCTKFLLALSLFFCDFDLTLSFQVILATAGYDHTIKFWQAHTGKCVRTLQHADSQVNALEISPDGQILAAAGYQVRFSNQVTSYY